MKDNLIKELALDFSKMTDQPTYFYDIDNWLYKAEKGEITKLSKSEPEKVEATIIVDEAEKYFKELNR